MKKIDTKLRILTLSFSEVQAINQRRNQMFWPINQKSDTIWSKKLHLSSPGYGFHSYSAKAIRIVFVCVVVFVTFSDEKINYLTDLKTENGILFVYKQERTIKKTIANSVRDLETKFKTAMFGNNKNSMTLCNEIYGNNCVGNIRYLETKNEQRTHLSGSGIPYCTVISEFLLRFLEVWCFARSGYFPILYWQSDLHNLLL